MNHSEMVAKVFDGLSSGFSCQSERLDLADEIVTEFEATIKANVIADCLAVVKKGCSAKNDCNKCPVRESGLDCQQKYIEMKIKELKEEFA